MHIRQKACKAFFKQLRHIQEEELYQYLVVEEIEIHGKRPIMGEISGRIANYSIITSDNPRTENPDSIVKQIEEGIKKTKGKYECIVNRTEAIKKAIMMANKEDIIVLAGKGHETYQEINHIKNPYDERIIVRDLVDEIIEERSKTNK